MKLIKHNIRKMYRSLRVWPVAMLCGVMLLWSGCSSDEFLTPDPASFTSTANYYTEPDHFESALAAAYDGLRDWASIQNGDFRLATELRSDATNRQFDINLPGIDNQAVVGWYMNPSNDGTISLWEDVYQTIYRANIVLSRLEDIEWDGNTDQRDRIQAEAWFIRAMSYYYAVQIWGDTDGSGVPLVLEETSSPNDALDKTLETRANVLARVVTDLQNAASVLPSSTDSEYDNGRASSGAANYLLGKTRILTGDNTGAITALESLSSDYSLVLSGFMDVFDPGNNYNSESIFELSYALNVPGQPSRSAEIVIPHHYRDEGVMNTVLPVFSGNTQIDGSNNGMYPAFQLWDYFTDVANDDRYQDGFTWTEDATNLTVNSATSYPGSVAHFPGDASSDSIATINKWFWPANTDEDDLGGNEVVFRYADALLALAEAHWLEDEYGDAIGYINDIRDRAGLGLTGAGTINTDYPTPNVLTGTYLDGATLDQAVGRAIFMERTVELLGEGHRMLDLMRFSRHNDGTLAFAETVLDAAYQDRLSIETLIEGQTSITIDQGEIVWPIPPPEIQNSTGDIEQNEYYQF